MVYTSYIWRGDDQTVSIHLFFFFSFPTRAFIKLCHTFVQLSPFQAQETQVLGCSMYGSCWTCCWFCCPSLYLSHCTVSILETRDSPAHRIHNAAWVYTGEKLCSFFFLYHFSLPNNSYNFICYWAVGWCFPSSYMSFSFQTSPVVVVIISESSDLEFFPLSCEELLTLGYFWICHMLVSFDILHFSNWRNLKNE